MKEYLEILEKTVLFRGISAEECENLLENFGARRQRFLAEEIILRVGMPIGCFGVLLQGRAQVVREDYAGSRTIITQLEQGELFAETYAFLEKNKSPVSVTAISECVVLWINADRTVKEESGLDKARARFSANLLTVFAQKNLLLGQRLGHLSKRTTREKLLSYLYEQAALFDGKTAVIPFGRQQLADYLCVERSAMCAVLSQLRREGVLETQGRRVFLKQTCAEEHS